MEMEGMLGDSIFAGCDYSGEGEEVKGERGCARRGRRTGRTKDKSGVRE